MPFGFKPARMRDGSPYNASVQQCHYLTAADLFVGDVVALSGTAEANTGIPGVLKATAGSAAYGVVVGIDPVRTNLDLKYIPSGTTGYVYVESNPNVVFHATEDGVGGYLAITDVGNNVNFIAGTGVAATGKSGAMLDSSTKATTSTLNFRIQGKAQIPGNDLGTTSTVWEVTINNSNAVANQTGV